MLPLEVKTYDRPEGRIVVNCPNCRRVMWANSICSHGQVPSPRENGPGGVDLEDPKALQPPRKRPR